MEGGPGPRRRTEGAGAVAGGGWAPRAGPPVGVVRTEASPEEAGPPPSGVGVTLPGGLQGVHSECFFAAPKSRVAHT